MCMPCKGHTDWGGVWETLKYLRELGHNVSVASGNSLRNMSQESGFSFIDVGLPDFQLKTPDKSMKQILETHLSENFFNVNSHYNAINKMLDVPIDILISDSYCRSAPIITKLKDIPHVVIAPDPKEPNVELYQTLLSYAKNFEEAMLDFTGVTFPYNQKYPLIFKSVNLNIHYSTPEFMEIKETDATKFVGGDPINKSPRSNRIYFSSGTLFWDNKLQKAVEAIAQDSEIELHTNNLNGVVSTPRGTIVHKFVDELHQMGTFDVLIAQGGYGTISKGIRAGIPILIASLFIGNSLQAYRIQKYGNGISLNLEEQTSHNFAISIRKLLNENSFRAKAEELKESYTNLGGSRKATELILNLC